MICPRWVVQIWLRQMQSLSGYWFQHQLKTCLSYPMADTLAGWVYDAKVDSHSQRHNYPGLWPVQWSGGTKYLLSNPSEMQLTILTVHGHSSPKFSSCSSLELNFIVLPLPDNTENSILSELTFILCTHSSFVHAVPSRLKAHEYLSLTPPWALLNPFL